jgi:hypothetical protein
VLIGSVKQTPMFLARPLPAKYHVKQHAKRNQISLPSPFLVDEPLHFCTRFIDPPFCLTIQTTDSPRLAKLYPSVFFINTLREHPRSLTKQKIHNVTSKGKHSVSKYNSNTTASTATTSPSRFASLHYTKLTSFSPQIHHQPWRLTQR